EASARAAASHTARRRSAQAGEERKQPSRSVNPNRTDAGQDTNRVRHQQRFHDISVTTQLNVRTATEDPPKLACMSNDAACSGDREPAPRPSASPGPMKGASREGCRAPPLARAPRRDDACEVRCRDGSSESTRT